MKTTIYELLGMIKDGKAPYKILYKCDDEEYVFKYNEFNFDYQNELGVWLFEDICFDGENHLNKEVTLLETTITYKPDKIEKLSYQQIGLWALEQHNWVDYARAVDKQIQQIGSKINEIIDKVNKND